MILSELMQSITDKTIPHFLILFGEEQAVLDVYIHHIIQTLNASCISCDTIATVIQKVNKKSLNKSTKLYIVDEDISYIKAENAWQNVQKVFNNKGKHYLIIRYHTIDKRSAFYKQHSNIVEFTHLNDTILVSYIHKDLPDLSDKNAFKLIKYCNYDYGTILMEIDKIWQLQAYRLSNFNMNLDSNDCFEKLDKQGLFHKEIGDITFELTNAVLGGYPATAIQKLDEAKRKGEPAMMIASILYNGFRNLLAYQGLGSNKKGALERTGMTKGELYGCSKNVGGYSISEVKRNMLICQKVESGIKMGRIDEDIALEYVVLSCLK